MDPNEWWMFKVTFLVVSPILSIAVLVGKMHKLVKTNKNIKTYKERPIREHLTLLMEFPFFFSNNFLETITPFTISFEQSEWSFGKSQDLKKTSSSNFFSQIFSFILNETTLRSFQELFKVGTLSPLTKEYIVLKNANNEEKGILKCLIERGNRSKNGDDNVSPKLKNSIRV